MSKCLFNTLNNFQTTVTLNNDKKHNQSPQASPLSTSCKKKKKWQLLF